MKAKKMMIFVISCVVIFSCFGVFASAQTLYISELVIISDETKIAEFEKNGYNILFQGLNMVTDDESPIYLAYKKGSNAITDIIVSDSKSNEIAVGTVVYSLVSEINLNKGTNGNSIYLYYTRDKSIGSGITALNSVSGFSNVDTIIPLLNDGSSPVRTQDGKLANFDKGINNCEIYIIKESAENVRPYISNVKIVSGTTKNEAIKNAANSGCDYYLDCSLQNDNSYTFLAYQRTSKKNEAVTNFTINDSNVYIEKNANSSKYLIDISEYELFENDFNLSDWAPLYVSTSKTISKDCAEYIQLANSNNTCFCMSVGSNPSIFALYLGSNSTQEITTENIFESTTLSVNEETTQDISDLTDVTDEFFETEKEDDAVSTTETEEDENAMASVLGGGSIIIIISFALFIIAVLVILKFVMKGRKRNEKNT